MLDLNWTAAGAGVPAAAENGVTTPGDSGSETPQASPAAVVAEGISRGDLYAVAFILALAILASALIIHHGLVA